MFQSNAKFTLYGEALGHHIAIKVEVSAPSVDASPVPADGQAPLLVDTQNIQTMLLSALNTALIKLQHMDQNIGGDSLFSIRPGRAPKTEPVVDAVPVVPYPRKTPDGEGIN